MNRTIYSPTYIEDFHCIGPKCENTCCRDWSIDINKAIFKKYRDSGHPMFDDLKGIFKDIEGGNKRIILENRKDEETGIVHGYCPLFNEDGLCEIHKNFGELYLSNTCRIYPRQVGYIEQNTYQMSLSLSCPEAARKALLIQEPMQFKDIEFPLVTHSFLLRSFNRIFTHDNITSAEYSIVRDTCIKIIQYRDISLIDRMMILGMYIQKLNEPAPDINVLSDKYLGFLTGITPDTFGKLRKSPSIQMGVGKAFMHYLNRLSLIEYIESYNELTGQDMEDFDSNVFGAEVSEANLLNYYKVFNERYIPYMQEHGYIILENFIVNEIFRLIFPFNNKDIWHSMLILSVDYLIIRNLMMGAAYKGFLNDENTIKIISLYQRHFSHNANMPEFYSSIMELIELNSLGGLYLLLHE